VSSEIVLNAFSMPEVGDLPLQKHLLCNPKKGPEALGCKTKVFHKMLDKPVWDVKNI